MKPAGGMPHAEPFFLDGQGGSRFCLYHAPFGPCRGAVLYIAPFAEEMNRARRMAALQARQLAALGYAVLQPDLYGCGDSSGDFGEARWEIWKSDLAAAAHWLQQRHTVALHLWGLRLGALLALDYARGAPHGVATMLLWQPVLSGTSYLTQFLRLRAAGALLANEATDRVSPQALRVALQSGETLEIAGYDLAPAMAMAIDSLAPLEELAPACPVHWFEAVNPPAQGPSPAAARASAQWLRQGVPLQMHTLPAPPFWASPEITVAPAWLEKGAELFQAQAQ